MDTDAKNCAEENKTKRSRYKLRRRLRYLTDQSDYILNEDFPGNDSSDSDSSDTSDPEIVDRVISRRFPLRDLLIDSSSDSSSDTLVAGSSPSVHHEESRDIPSVQDAEPLVSQAVNNSNQASTNGCDSQKPPEKESEWANLDESSERVMAGEKFQPDPNNCSLKSGPIVKLGPVEMKNALQCLCPPNSTSPAAGCPECSKGESTTPGAVFKSISIANKSFRKRRVQEDECNAGSGSPSDQDKLDPD